MTQASWQPTASLESLRARARMLQQIRAFFVARQVLEVETPALSQAAVTDAAINSIPATLGEQTYYLHTSPEFPMKRLLAAGYGDIFQLCKVFRGGELGHRHNPEFTLLEWYRLDFDHHRLMKEVVDLVQQLTQPMGIELTVKKISYQQAFETTLGIDPLAASVSQLAALAADQGIDFKGKLSCDGWLDLLISERVTAVFPAQQLTLLHAYPASQAALARLETGGRTAARFEVFWGNVELANGFYELKNADEQRQRFQHENTERAQAGLPVMPVDENLLDALASGLPDCAGVALGVDRLLMQCLQKKHIREVLAFSQDRS